MQWSDDGSNSCSGSASNNPVCSSPITTCPRGGRPRTRAPQSARPVPKPQGARANSPCRSRARPVQRLPLLGESDGLTVPAQDLAVVVIAPERTQVLGNYAAKLCGAER